VPNILSLDDTPSSAIWPTLADATVADLATLVSTVGAPS
jgi:hypothetical protein